MTRCINDVYPYYALVRILFLVLFGQLKGYLELHDEGLMAQSGNPAGGTGGR